MASWSQQNKKKKLGGFSLQANYTDQAVTTSR
jgi:hypothetical protein